MPEPCILWPVAFAAPAPALRVVTGGVERTATLTGVVADDLDEWFVAEDDLIAEILDALNALPGGVVWSAVLDEDNFLTLESSAPASILWTHAATTLDPRVLGWTDADVGPGVLFEAPNQTQGCWIPGLPGDPRTYREDTDLEPQTAVVITRTLDGWARGYDLSPEPGERTISFYRIEAARVLEQYVLPTWPSSAFATAWGLGGMSAGRAFRLYDDRSNRAQFSVYQCVSGARGRPWVLEAINGSRRYEIGPLELVEVV